MLERYYNENYPFSQEQTISVEEELKWDIEGFRFIGYADRISIVPEQNKLIIHDYKTSSTLPEIEDLKTDKQLAMYQMALEQNSRNAGMKIELVYHFLQFGKKICIHKTAEEQNELKNALIQTIQKIEIAEWEQNFNAHVSDKCQWCDYISLCHAYNKKENKPTI